MRKIDRIILLLSPGFIATCEHDRLSWKAWFSFWRLGTQDHGRHMDYREYTKICDRLDYLVVQA